MATQKHRKVKGALPCGNPQRIESSEVIKMTSKRKISTLEGTDIETESEKHLKSMLHNQIDVETSMEEQFSRHRTFTTPATFDPTADKLIGLHALNQHKELNDVDSKIEHYRQCGLTEEEILFLLRKDKVTFEKGAEKDKRFGPDPSIEQKWLEEIERKIKSKEEDLKKADTFKGGLELSRQSLDLEKSMLNHQNKHSALAPGIIRQKQPDPSHPDDPINHIGDMMEEIDAKPQREPRRDRRRRRKLHRQMLRQQLYNKNFECDNKEESPSREDNDMSDDPSFASQNSSCNATLVESTVDENIPENEHTFKTRIMEVSSKSEDHCGNSAMTKTSSCNKSKSKKSDEKEMKDFITDVSFVPEQEVIANRLTLDEIISLDRFKNYEMGEPNNIVFVKNLPNDTKDNDIVALFGPYQKDDENITFRLLTGRMKGQAFVTFQDSSTAGKAMSFLNGYKLRGRPMILTYGKRKMDE